MRRETKKKKRMILQLLQQISVKVALGRGRVITCCYYNDHYGNNDIDIKLSVTVTVIIRLTNDKTLLFASSKKKRENNNFKNADS